MCSVGEVELLSHFPDGETEAQVTQPAEAEPGQSGVGFSVRSVAGVIQADTVSELGPPGRYMLLHIQSSVCVQGWPCGEWWLPTESTVWGVQSPGLES